MTTLDGHGTNASPLRVYGIAKSASNSSRYSGVGRVDEILRRISPPAALPKVAPRAERREESFAPNLLDERLYVPAGMLDGLRIIRNPLRVTTSDEDEDGIWVTTDGFSTVYGSGESPQEASEDYVKSLGQHLIWLEENVNSLGPGLASELDSIRLVIEHVTSE